MSAVAGYRAHRLNHISGHKRGVAGIYILSVYEREARAALALWEDHLHALVTGRVHKIVAMRPLAAS